MKRKQKIIDVNMEDNVPKNFTGIVRMNEGTIEYVKNGRLHREDGPALIRLNGTKGWYKNGLLHREDGPAVIWNDGTEDYYYKGKFYNHDGYWHRLYLSRVINKKRLITELL